MRPRADIYSEASWWQHRHAAAVDDAEVWFLHTCLMQFAVPIPVGEDPSAYDGRTRPSPRVLALRAAIREDRPFRSVRIPRQRTWDDVRPAPVEQPNNNRGGR